MLRFTGPTPASTDVWRIIPTHPTIKVNKDMNTYKKDSSPAFIYFNYTIHVFHWIGGALPKSTTMHL